MRPIRPALAGAVLALMLVFAPAAGAGSATVTGKGDIDKLVVDNGQKALSVKLYGLGGPCDAHYFKIVVFWSGKPAYQADGGCYPGAEWATSLYYFADKSGQEGKAVKCPKFRLDYNKKGKFHRLTLPRSCMGRAPDRIKVRSEGDNYGSVTGGEAGPTRALKRG